MVKKEKDICIIYLKIILLLLIGSICIGIIVESPLLTTIVLCALWGWYISKKAEKWI